ncbi:MAG: two-component sensor histidine kinase [Frankiales bacterium]|nr:two-component sensor histidine kinase [Frankiales bacterium]
MLATASVRERLLVPAWLVFAGANAVLMFFVPGAETIPFHFVWVSTALVYGLQPWSLRYMWLTCAVVTLVTGIPLALHARSGGIGWQETTEIPLMALLFLVMVWHVRRRMAATAEALRLTEVERRSRETQRRFVRLASHELRTPITVARGFTELLRNGHAELAADDDVAVVLDELDKLAAIAARLLALAQSDEVSAHPEMVDLAVLLERTARRWRAAAPHRRWLVECTELCVRADPARLEAAIDSVVENAVRHTEEGGTVVLRGTARGDEVLLAVEDDGLGIAPADLELVFEAFHSAGPHAGTGLGLAIVKAVAETHGGRVSAANGERGGAVITLMLPCIPREVPLTI